MTGIYYLKIFLQKYQIDFCQSKDDINNRDIHIKIMCSNGIISNLYSFAYGTFDILVSLSEGQKLKRNLRKIPTPKCLVCVK